MQDFQASVVRTLLTEVWSEGNLSRLPEIMMPELVAHLPASPTPLKGLEAYRQFVALYHGIFESVGFSVADQFGEGDRLATRWIARLGDSQEDGGVMGMSIHRFEGERIAEAWDTWDMLSVLQSGAGPDYLEQLTINL